MITTLASQADEGMWLPNLLGEGRIRDMRNKGLRLTAEDLYSINEASLKDAIVRFGGGCTAELISDKGLLLTNHHCGYGQIQAHSSVEKDYLTHGFAAMNAQEELPNPSLTVSFLRSMSDVTEQVLSGVTDKTDEKSRDNIINANIKSIVSSATEGNTLKATVEALYYGNQYFLFTYKVYQDVRLVFAPPSSIGKFGGDTDNWMWPRHTGDFTVFRIYADANNEPAAYSSNNVPFRPDKSLKISAKGVQEGDFTFVYGFPGRTTQYLHSDAVQYLQQMGNPLKIKLRTIRLDIMNREQAKDPAVRIKYAAKNAGVSNAWKKWQGELLGVERLGTVESKRLREAEFATWAAYKPTYRGLTDEFKALYDELAPLAYARDFYNESALACEILQFASSFADIDTAKIEILRKRAGDFYKNYDPTIDHLTTDTLLKVIHRELNTCFQPEMFASVTPARMVDSLFLNSVFTDEKRFMKLLDDPKARDIIKGDIAVAMVGAFKEKMKSDITPSYDSLTKRIDLLYRKYTKGLMEMQPKRSFYPDANSTLRVAYGKVDGYTPRDGVYYKPVSTLEGVMQKDNPEIYDYDIPEKLREIYRTKDYGRWASEGTIPVCFIASNHTTGGNSGSPILNSRGELIGLNFDRCWEGTMSDIQYDPEVCRNIALDIRYVLFMIDRFGAAGYLIDEMDIAE